MSSSTSLFQVYLRLRPPIQGTKERSDSWLIVEPPAIMEEQPAATAETETVHFPTHITLQPPHESRKRAIERFGFTKIFTEEATQSDVFDEIRVADSIRSTLQTGRDGLIATLGVTGSGKVSLDVSEELAGADEGAESYYSGLEITTRSHTDGIGCAIPIDR